MVGERHGVDIGAHGFAGLPSTPILSSGHIHASARKAIGMAGMGRANIRTFAKDTTGRLDVDALSAALEALDGAPAILVANAGR